MIHPRNRANKIPAVIAFWPISQPHLPFLIDTLLIRKDRAAVCTNYKAKINGVRIKSREKELVFGLVPRENIRPTDFGPLVLPEQDSLVCRDMRWLATRAGRTRPRTTRQISRTAGVVLLGLGRLHHLVVGAAARIRFIAHDLMTRPKSRTSELPLKSSFLLFEPLVKVVFLFHLSIPFIYQLVAFVNAIQPA